MPGVEILNTIPHYSTNNVPKFIPLLLFIFVVIGMYLVATSNNHIIAIISGAVVIVMLLTIVFITMTGSFEDKNKIDYYTYEVKIDPIEVSYKEFTDVYEIINERGLIIEVREREKDK